MPVDRRLLLRGNHPVRLESPEMIDPQNVHDGEHRADPVRPPRISPRSHLIPSINGVAPVLARSREIVGRDAGNNGRRALLVEMEQIGMAPYVAAVMGHKWEVSMIDAVTPAIVL